MAPEFIDAATRSVLGTHTFLERLTPDSKFGEKLAATPRHFAPSDQDAWREEMARLVEADAWTDTAGQERVRQALGELPLLERPLRKLQVGQVLGEAELFTIKRFLFYGAQALEEARELVQRWGVCEGYAEKIVGLMQAIHPQKRPTPRFHLAAELSDVLDVLRGELRQKKKRERRARAEIEEAIVADHGGKFDIHGTFHPPGELTRDERLEQTASGWILADEEVRSLACEIERLEAQVDGVEYELRQRLSDRLGEEADWLAALADLLAMLDVRLSKVRLRRDIGGCWPSWNDVDGDSSGQPTPDQPTPNILIEAGREPEVASRIAPEDVQPVGVTIGHEPVVVTGPNMGGKSVLLRLIGICQWCAQHAMPAPAERCEVSPVHAIVYVGSEEPLARDVHQGLSSFGREVERLVAWWDRGESPRLWLLDELGRGTHPDEGAKIAAGVIEALAERGDRVVAATHFPAVAALESATKLRIAGLTHPERLEALLEGDGSVEQALREAMDYRPVAVDTHDVPRDATVVARALGLDLSRR